MADFALPPISLSPALLQAQGVAAQPASATGDEAAKRASIAKASKDFESSFLSVMLGQMFEGVNKSDGPFNGGAGEQAFKSFMTDAIAKQMTRTGGVGLAATVQKEMLKLQGLS
jgi:flagellar protein FlgJ